jgi:hypothetical protein
MPIIFAIATAILVLVLPAAAEPLTVLKNDKGQVTGYATTRGNVTTYEDAAGRQTGRAERKSDGTVIYFDAKGRQIGSARK